MTEATGIASAVAVFIALVLRGSPPMLVGRARSKAPASNASTLKRLRVPLTLLAGAAAWAFVGGAIGIGAGVCVAVMAWRTLANARSPAAIRRDEQLRSDYPLVVQLLAHVLSAGTDVRTALGLVAKAVGDPWESRLALCLNALGIGQSPAEVWADLERDPLTSGLGRALARSHLTGVPVSKAMHVLAQDLREEADLLAHAYARTIEVRAAAPLGVCFLPAFVLLGIVPLVAGILRGLAWAGAS